MLLYLDIFEHLTKNVICHLKLNMIKPSESSPLFPSGRKGLGDRESPYTPIPNPFPSGEKGSYI
jgi:hypothetical protein